MELETTLLNDAIQTPKTNKTYFLLVVDPSCEVLDVRVLPGVTVDSRKFKRDHGGDRGILERRTVKHS